ncbi:MAG: metallophosphoesterase [Gammaproteobacteria bacterium]|nr:metallophosphoesterase [Gammaproteobacteria bacterium]
MGRVFFILAAYLVFAYPWLRYVDWMTGNAGLAIGISVALWILGMIGMHYSFVGPNLKVRYPVVHWLGAGFILASTTFIAEFVRLITAYPDSVVANGTLICAGLVMIVANLLSHHISVRKMDIPSYKVSRTWRVVQLSDVHIGSRQTGYFRRVIRKVQKLNPDFVVITGDLIDSSAVEIESLQPLTWLDMPVYFSIGNHELYADMGKVMDMSGKLGLRTLRQQSNEFGEFCITGIDDAPDPDQVSRQLPNISRNQEKFNILLYHRPQGWESAIDHGIDLMLSGHTHKGQIFPFNFVVRKYFKRTHGLHSHGGRYFYISPGTGTWGPLMRLGSYNEISMFTITPSC